MAQPQVPTFGSREEREHGPSHCLGKRGTASGAVLALPSCAEKTRGSRYTHSLRLCLLVRGQPGWRTYTHAGTPAAWGAEESGSLGTCAPYTHAHAPCRGAAPHGVFLPNPPGQQ